MQFSLVRLRSYSIAFVACVACRDEARKPHVFSAPPPQPPSTGTTSVPTPELPAGSNPLARFEKVYDFRTGAAVPLDALPDSFAMQVIAARGPAQPPPTGQARLELFVDGSRDTTLVLNLPSPAPSVVAHSFEVVGLAPGRYKITVQLVDALGITVRSVPLVVEVRPRN